MSAASLAVALLVGSAAFLFIGPDHSRVRLRAISARIAVHQTRCGELGENRDRAASGGMKSRVPLLSCLMCGGVAWLFIGGVSGAVAGVAVAFMGPRLLARFESRGTRANRLALEVAAPTVADLMAACLASGTSTAAATQATAEALGGPAAEVLRQCVVQFNLGASAARVWKPMQDQESLAPIARAILRSAETGAPLTSVLLRVADDQRQLRRARLDQAAKAVGVKAVGPLGLCFLPAFMLLGVVPLIASLVSEGLSG